MKRLILAALSIAVLTMVLPDQADGQRRRGRGGAAGKKQLKPAPTVALPKVNLPKNAVPSAKEGQASGGGGSNAGPTYKVDASAKASVLSVKKGKKK